MTTHSVEDRNEKVEAMEKEAYLQKLTEEELTKLKHALGFDNKESKDGVFEAYRRCSLYDEIDDVWEELVNKGYAKHSPCGVGWYVVTESGMQAVADMTGLTVKFKLEFEPSDSVKRMICNEQA